MQTFQQLAAAFLIVIVELCHELFTALVVLKSLYTVTLAKVVLQLNV